MRRAVNILAMIMLVGLAFGLYKAKTEAKDDRRRLAALETALIEEQDAILVMRNEVSFLESPDRLRRLAEKHLGLVPIDPLRVVTLEDAPLLIEPPASAEERPPTATAAYPERRRP